jgi:hypothetical protein
VMAGLIQWRVGQTSQYTGFVERSLAMPGQVDQGESGRSSLFGRRPSWHRLILSLFLVV